MANDFMNCRIRTSLRLFGMPHKKNSAVTRKKGTSCPAGKSGPCPDPLVVGSVEFETCILRDPLCPCVAMWSRATRPRVLILLSALAGESPATTRSPLVHAHHDLLDPGRIIAPCRHSLRSFIHVDDRTDGVVHRKAMFFQHANDIAKILRQSISRSENVEFLLHEQFGLVSYRLFGITD